VLSRLLLDKKLSEVRWRALGTLLFAVLIICYETKPPPKPDMCADSAAVGAGAAADERQESEALAAAARAADYAVGVAAVSLEAALSGFSNVYFERVLKSTSLSLWERNVQVRTPCLAQPRLPNHEEASQ
jgi:UDP-sugar transporter A1/2/3